MKYESPKFEKVEFESADILMASGEVDIEVGIKVEETSESTADFIVDISKLFNS